MPSEQKHGVPALLSLFIPVLGQAVKGQIGRGIGIMFAAFIGYLACGIPGFFVHVWNVIDAYSYNPRQLSHSPQQQFNVNVQGSHVNVHLGQESTRGQIAQPVQQQQPQPVRSSTGGLKGLGSLFIAGAAMLSGLNFLVGPIFDQWMLVAAASAAMGSLLWGVALRRDTKEDLKRKAELERLKVRVHEKEVLQLALQRGGRLTISDVAANTSLSLEEAKATLERMAISGHVGTTIAETGALVYQFFDVEQVDVKRLEHPAPPDRTTPSEEHLRLEE